MRIRFRDERLAFVIGDVRDRYQIANAMRGVNYVFHAAALKQVPSCEFFPIEAVRTNIIGTHHVLEAAEQHGVEKLVVLSTDKAVYPINAMGQTKALMEKLMLARGREPHSTVTYCGVRYGNVMYSRGSVIPLFVDQIKRGEPLTITHSQMTRLLLPLGEAVELVTVALEHAGQGDILVRKSPAATVGDLAHAMLNLFDAPNDIQVVGIREGEKMHEVLITPEEFARAEELDEYYRVPTQRERNYDEFFTRGKQFSAFAKEGYTSENARQLSVPEVEQLLLRLPEIRSELAGWSKSPTVRRMAA
jgi:UDP-glucose 4-epimerase